MSIPITDKFKPRNNGTFPLVDAEDVLMPDGSRLSEFTGGGTITVDAALDLNSTNPVQNKVICEQLAQAEVVLQQLQASIPTEAQINALIDAKLGVIENGSY